MDDPANETLRADHPDAADRLASVLGGGGVAVLPTDTVYGLAAAADHADAVARLFALKARQGDVPLAVLCADAGQALALAGPLGPVPARFAAEHWPGALTMVLPRRADLDWSLGEPSNTIGVRCPDHDLVRAVAARIGPIATTSANRHGTPTPPDAAAAAATLTGPVDLVVDAGPLARVASTVIDLTGAPRVLRQGSVQLDLDAPPP